MKTEMYQRKLSFWKSRYSKLTLLHSDDELIGLMLKKQREQVLEKIIQYQEKLINQLTKD